MAFLEIANWIGSGIQVLSDGVTAVIGLATIFAFFRYRKRISGLLRLMRINHLHDRHNEIRQTLDLIDAAPVVKGRGIRSLFGRLNGQMMPLCGVLPELNDLQSQVQSIAHENGRLNETVKQQIVYQIRAQFESARFSSLNQAVGDEK